MDASIRPLFPNPVTNDICLRSHNNYCKDIKQAKFGYISTGNVSTNDDNMELDVINDELVNLDIQDDFSLAAGVFECKMDYYSVHQTIAEMIRCAGELLADALIRGYPINIINIFGLALYYNSASAKLVHVTVDFHKGVGKAFVSDDTLPIYSAICWLLNAIVMK